MQKKILHAVSVSMHAAMHAGESSMGWDPFYSEVVQFQSTTRMLHLVVVTLE